MARFVIAACLALFLFHGARAETVQDVEALMAQADKVWGTKFAYIEERLIKALEIAERLTGPSSATTEAVVNKRGRNAFNAGWYPLAERMFRRDVVLSIALHGDSVPAARAMGDLAAALREQCKLDEASEQILDSIAMRRRILPPKDYAWLASGYDNLSKIRELQHRDDDAIAAQKDAVRIATQAGGDRAWLEQRLACLQDAGRKAPCWPKPCKPVPIS